MVGCAEERDPINRVQGNVFPKKFLVGEKYNDPSDDPEFYARTMVIDVPYGESSADWGMFTNSINTVSKIKWSFEGNEGEMLVGRVSFERIDGTDSKGLPRKTDAKRDPNLPLAQNDGVAVYMFPVKHFDIRRAYNSQTGEEQNVLEENTSDRQWQDRDYVRVDFSENKVTEAYDFDTLSLLGIYGGVKYTSAPLYVQNPKDINAPVIDVEHEYFDVTNKVFGAPQDLHIWGMKFPGCMLPNIIQGGTEPVGNCNPNEITLRHSFRKVVDKDYEPVDWDGKRFEAYGAFTTVRNGYARDYGMADAKWKRYISRYNIWERSHYYKDPEKMQGAVSCKVDSECTEKVGAASHCDTFNEKCTLPFAERKAKPIVWHYADGSPAMYYEATREAAEEWDTAMRAAVLAAKYAECKRFTDGSNCGTAITGNFAQEEDAIFLTKEINACRRGETAEKNCDQLADDLGAARHYDPAVVEVAKMPQMVILCHSPVDAKDPEVCGKPGTVARLGDLRFNLVTNVAKPETNSPWGIMSDGNDPLTGEKVAASINVWTHVNDLFARGLIDTLRYIGGELKTEDITDGKYVNAWVEAARQMNGVGLTPTMTEDEMDKRVAAAAGTTVEKLRAAQAEVTSKAGKLSGEKAQLRAALVNNLKKVAQTRAAWDAPSVNAPIYQARANMVKGTPVEAAAVTPAMQQLASSSFGQVALDPATKTAATSIFQGLDPAVRRGFEQRFHQSLAARGTCIMPFEATAPIGYVALGDVLQAKFGKFNPNDTPAAQAERADKMKDYVRRRAQYAVIAHEMGHSFALRHNFVSSSDAWNFRWQYWALRTNAKQANKACDAKGTQDGKTCVGPRWTDPVTPNESKNIIHMWAQSSTMEYPGEPTQDMLGLGAYDFGAARMFYGDTATVYADKRFLSNSVQGGACAMDHQDEFGGLLGYRFCDFSNPTHYSQLDASFNLIEKCETVSADAYKPANWDEAKNGIWNPVIDGHLVTNESGATVKCTQPKVDFVPWTSLVDAGDKTHAHDGSAGGKAGRVRVPHGFASDEWADLGNIAVYRHDNGADIYETMQFWVAQQEMNHIFTNYRRGRRDFSIWGAFNRTLSRYHEKMRDSAKAIALYATLARDTVSQYNSGGDPSGFVAEVLKQIAVENVTASSIAFDHFAHVFARPQPGGHGPIGNDPNDTVLRSFEGTGFAGTGNRPPVLNVANGVQGGFGNISLGGRPIENALARNVGRDYDRDYTLNVGDYYEKAFSAMLFTESADNFISSSRDDFVDPRFRSVSIADVFPDGFRRWLANNLTNDDAIKGVAVRGVGQGTGTSAPDLDPNDYATLGTTSWWPSNGIEYCFPQGERINCRDPFAAASPAGVSIGGVVDPQVGWEQQKFLILFTLLYLPENNRVNWLDQMGIYQLGPNADPGFDNRIEFHDPSGRVYIARTFGTETLLGKTVQKGVAARMLEYANELLARSMDVTKVDGKTATWYLPVIDAQGKMKFKQPSEGGGFRYVDSCDQSRDCTKLQNYMSVPKFLREAMDYFGWTRNAFELKGVY
jgi:hypothetical protein